MTGMHAVGISFSGDQYVVGKVVPGTLSIVDSIVVTRKDDSAIDINIGARNPGEATVTNLEVTHSGEYTIIWKGVQQ